MEHCIKTNLQEKKKPTIIFLHGLFENKETARINKIKEQLDQLGYPTVICDANGHGQNKGKRTDWKTAFNEEEELIDQYNDVILIGHSMGATKAITHGMSNQHVKKVFAISGMHDSDDLKSPNIRQMATFVLAGIGKKEIESDILCVLPDSNKIKNKPEYYLIHGEKDYLVEYEQCIKNMELLDIPNDNHLVFKNGNHIDVINKDTIEFIKNKLSKKD